MRLGRGMIRGSARYHLSKRLIVELEIHPYAGLGAVRFNMTCDQARAAIGIDPQLFEKAPGTIVENYGGLHLYYDNDGRLEFIEVGLPNQVSFGGIALLNMKIADAVAKLEPLGGPVKRSGSGYDFEQLGLGLFESGGLVKGVSAYRRGYYD